MNVEERYEKCDVEESGQPFDSGTVDRRAIRAEHQDRTWCGTAGSLLFRKRPGRADTNSAVDHGAERSDARLLPVGRLVTIL